VTKPSNTPSQILAKTFAEKLVSSGLARKENQQKLAEKIAEGKMAVADWRLEIELATGVGGGK
jgi:hypothetical protein